MPRTTLEPCSLAAAARRFYSTLLAFRWPHTALACTRVNIENHRNKIDFRRLKPINSLNIKLLDTSRKHMVVLSRIGELVALDYNRFELKIFLEPMCLDCFFPTMSLFYTYIMFT